MTDHPCPECDRTFSSQDALEMHNKAKHDRMPKQPLMTQAQKKSIRRWFYGVLAAIVIIGIFWIIAAGSKTLPPIDMKGHIEVNPPSHIMREPMSLAVHKHMLEHADGKGRPGVMINYNCDDFECPAGLIERLEAFAEESDYVYVAPFPDMDAKIVLSKLGRRLILDDYSEEEIRAFIR